MSGAPRDSIHRPRATSCSRTAPASMASSAGAAERPGWDGAVLGEVVFNTAMTGYQEAMTDPSYAGQLITFTYPLIGNYGVSAPAMESDRIHARAAIMREAKNSEDAASCEGGWIDWLRDCGVPAITGLDTRSLVRHIRDLGAMRGGLFAAARQRERRARADRCQAPAMAGADLARTVTPGEAIEIAGDGPHIVALDTGIKQSILRQFRERGAPPDAAALFDLRPRTCSAATPTSSSSPTAQATPPPSTTWSRPSAASSARHRSSASASATRSSAAPSGWRRSSSRSATAAATTRSRSWRAAGSRSPRKTTASRSRGPGGETRIEADEPVRWETDFGAAELSHINLYDRTVEGLVLRDVAGSHRPVPPRSRPRAARRTPSFRPLLGDGRVIWPPHDDELHGTIVSMRPLAEADRENLRAAGERRGDLGVDGPPHPRRPGCLRRVVRRPPEQARGGPGVGAADDLLRKPAR